MHLANLRRLFGILGAFRVHHAGHHDQVGPAPQLLVPTIGLHQAGEVFDPVQAGDGEDRRFVGLLQATQAVPILDLKEHPGHLFPHLSRAGAFAVIGKIDLLANPGGDHVETGMEEVDPADHVEQPRHGEELIGFVLADAVLAAGDLLGGAGDDKVGLVHGDQIDHELDGEVVLMLKLVPVEVAEEIFRFFQGVGDIALDHSHAPGEPGGHQIAVGVVAHQQIRPPPQLPADLLLGIDRELIEKGPDPETGDPVRNHRIIGIAKGNPQNPDIVGLPHLLQALVGGGALVFRNQPGDNQDFGLDIEPGALEILGQKLFQGLGLIKDIDHLTAGVGPPQHVVLAEPAMGAEQHHLRNHGDTGEKLLQVGFVGLFKNILEHMDGLQHPGQ